MLHAENLTKRFSGLVAVQDLNFDIIPGEILAIIGPNGAGKTTTIEMMEGILSPTSGSALFKGNPIDRRFREKVGIQFQHTALPEFITVEETLKLFSSLYHHRRPLEEVIEISSLRDILTQDNRKLSGGQRQRLLLAIALVNDPEFVFLDEPTTGLDPQARRNFWNLVENIKAENKTVLLTTHYMEEAEVLCDDIAIMDHGDIIARGSPAELLNQHFDGVIVRVPYDGPEEKLPEGAVKRNGSLELVTRNVETIMRSLMAREIPFDGLSIHSPNLDDLFIKLTGASLRA